MTATRIMIRATSGLVLLLSVAIGVAQNSRSLPAQLQGKWRIRRMIPTRTITCWDERQARSILGTEIEYAPTIFRWKNHTIPNPVSTSRTLNASEFRQEYSGGGANDSQVDFGQLGIRSPSVTIVSIAHPDADITGGGSVEIPGDTILLKAQNQIVISVCNVYFKADRISPTANK
jgi:hypothetical protein